jgi:N-acetylglucosaminyldiphosphoundecaprenol N-acetyl-beta-D-mannosaminyltransferase
VMLYIAARLRNSGLVRSQRLGRWGCTFNEFAFGSGPLKRLPALINILRGEMSLIGPRSVSPGEVSAVDRAAWRRFNLRPGLICLWWIRKRANIAYGTESESDSEYLETQSFWGDLGIGLRAIPAALYGEGPDLAPDRFRLLGIPIDNLTMDEAITSIVERARRDNPTQLCFVNADCVNIAGRDTEYMKVLRASELTLADGIGIKLAGKILNSNIRQNVNGTDLFPFLCAAMEKQGLSLYLLGGRPRVVDGVTQWIRSQYPALRVAGSHHGFFGEDETERVLADIRESRAEILLVAFGAPKQEKWIHAHVARTGSKVAVGVGGLFDFYSGRIPRAPGWVRELGMEWLYRFIQEPRRMWRRYFVGNFLFLHRVLSERFAGEAK